MRGSKFRQDSTGDVIPDFRHPALRPIHALEDVIEWLGFVDDDGACDEGSYLKALPIERERIFERATY